MNDTGTRRPLKVREVKFVVAFARYLSGKQITPNQISVISILFAALAAARFYLLCIVCTLVAVNSGGIDDPVPTPV